MFISEDLKRILEKKTIKFIQFEKKIVVFKQKLLILNLNTP